MFHKIIKIIKNHQNDPLCTLSFDLKLVTQMELQLSVDIGSAIIVLIFQLAIIMPRIILFSLSLRLVYHCLSSTRSDPSGTEGERLRRDGRRRSEGIIWTYVKIFFLERTERYGVEVQGRVRWCGTLCHLSSWIINKRDNCKQTNIYQIKLI